MWNEFFVDSVEIIVELDWIGLYVGQIIIFQWMINRLEIIKDNPLWWNIKVEVGTVLSIGINHSVYFRLQPR